jgi:hypothetical protein
VNRLSRAEFVFRRAVAGGVTLGDAAVSALDADDHFDVGRALVGLAIDGLIVAIGAV